MGEHDVLIDREREAWRALSTPGAAAGFYADVLADDVLFLLPGDLVIDDRQAVIDSMGGPPWSSFDLTAMRVVSLSPTSAVVTYRGSAVRDGQTYTALFSSTYVLDLAGSWRLRLHQQTPT